jgi:hypothetical protein
LDFVNRQNTQKVKSEGVPSLLYYSAFVRPTLELSVFLLVVSLRTDCGTAPWDGVDWLNPSKALVLSLNSNATKNQPTKEVQSEHDTNADPVAERRSIEQRYSQPVPQKHENPTLKAE